MAKKKGTIAGRAIKGSLKASAKIAKATSGVALAPLLPFKPLIIKTLAKKGIKPKSKRFRDIVQTFYDKIIPASHKRQKLEEYLETIDGINEHLEASDLECIEPVMITAVVSAVISFVKGTVEKKKAKEAQKKAAQGKAMTPEEIELVKQNPEPIKLTTVEETVAKGAESTEKAVKSEVKGQILQSIGGNTVIILVVVVIIGAVVFMRKK